MLIAKAEENPGQYIVILCNAVGCPIENKYITIEPKFVSMNKTHIIIACDDVVYYWQYRSQHSKLTTLEQEKKKKSGKENAFHIEEIPNPNLDTSLNIITGIAMSGSNRYSFYRINSSSELVNLGHAFTEEAGDSLQYERAIKLILQEGK